MDSSIGRLIGQIVRTVILLAIVGVIVNDGVQLARAFSAASDGLSAAMSAALDAASQRPTDQAQGQAAATAAAEAEGTRIEAYTQLVGESMGRKRAQVTLTVSAPVGRTVLVAPVIGLTRKTPRAQWYSDPRVSLREMKQADVFGQ